MSIQMSVHMSVHKVYDANSSDILAAISIVPPSCTSDRDCVPDGVCGAKSVCECPQTRGMASRLANCSWPSTLSFDAERRFF